MTGNNSSPELVFNGMGRKYALRRVGALGVPRTPDSCPGAEAMRQISSSSSHNLNYFSRLLQFAQTSELRKLLSNDPHLFHSVNDAQLRTRIASMLHSGSLGLFEFIEGSTSRSSSRAAAADCEYIDPKKIQSSSAMLISQPPTPKAAEKSESDFSLDESAQIAVLLEAAAMGAAFCEMCCRREEV